MNYERSADKSFIKIEFLGGTKARVTTPKHTLVIDKQPGRGQGTPISDDDIEELKCNGLGYNNLLYIAAVHASKLAASRSRTGGSGSCSSSAMLPMGHPYVQSVETSAVPVALTFVTNASIPFSFGDQSGLTPSTSYAIPSG